MDAKDAELYAEENREILLGIQRSLNALATTFSDEIRNLPEPLKSLEVSGKVQVNTEKEIAVSNLGDLEGWLWQLSDTVTLAIKNSAPEPLKSLTVDNIKDAKADKVKITNLGELKKELDKLADVIVTNKPIVQIDKQEVKMPKSATDYVSVRLTDGKRFYNALQAVTQAVAGIGNYGGATEAKQDDIISQLALKPNTDFDYIDRQQTSATVDTYVYKLGGASGTTIQTTVLTYTDSTKNNIDSVSYE